MIRYVFAWVELHRWARVLVHVGEGLLLLAVGLFVLGLLSYVAWVR